jgi:hypothetical protein
MYLDQWLSVSSGCVFIPLQSNVLLIHALLNKPGHCGLSLYNMKAPKRIYTSNTAQGGGGSFKNRKPIGEVGCCESGMAERIH